MSSFYGNYRSSVDDRGRIIIVKRLREGNASEDKSRYWLARGFDGCLAVFPLDEWEHFIMEARSQPFRKRDPRLYQRETFSNAYPAKIDRLGRILIQKELLDEFGIGKEVRLLGVSDHIEIWDPDTYDAYKKANEGRYEEVAEKLPIGTPQGEDPEKGSHSGPAR